VTAPARPSASSSPDGRGDLARLLATERRLEEAVARAREEAAALVARAREDAAAREGAAVAEFAAASRRLEATITAEQRRREVELAAQQRAEVERFNAVSADRVDALARYVVARVIGAEP
jgi:hypothetical protein